MGDAWLSRERVMEKSGNGNGTIKKMRVEGAGGGLTLR